MGRFTTFLACLHNLVIQVPQNGYHNISRVVQPQIRSLSESFTISGGSGRTNTNTTTTTGKDIGQGPTTMNSKRTTSTAGSNKEPLSEGVHAR